MKHIVFFSGGASSYAAAKRVIKTHGAENTILLFTDTNAEEASLYDFILRAKEKLNCELIWLDNDGVDIWDVAFDQKMVFNSKIANCTKFLKIKSAEKYIQEHFTPENCTLYLGLDWDEKKRHAAPVANWAPYTVLYPMNEAPLLFKEDYINDIKSDGLPVLESYKLGFEHGNCGGFCFKAGIGHFIHLLKTRPEYYYKNAQREYDLQLVIENHRRQTLPVRINNTKDKRKRHKLRRMYNTIGIIKPTILTRTINKRLVNLSLFDLADLYLSNDTYAVRIHLKYRKHLINKNKKPVEQPKITQSELFDFGGCGCFSTYNKE